MADEYVIAKYLRLSIEDERSESLSIENQSLLIDNHIDGLDIPNVKVLSFVDNGYSGTNMERPAVQEMLDLVQNSGVNLIIMKDFSRFSRNAMDSGYFIEQVFPLYQVRLISVSDNFDSDDYIGNTGGIDIAFKFLMHEYYSADLSAKVKSAKHLQMKRGENITANTVYGYCKAASGKWEPDGAASEVVKKIYGYAQDGFSSAQIRDKLFAERIPTPKEYMDIGRGKAVIPTFLWEARAVRRILTNVQYKGTYVSGKKEIRVIGSSGQVLCPKSEWIVIPDRHTPIIDPDAFDRVQEIMKAIPANEPKTESARNRQIGLTTQEQVEFISGHGKKQGALSYLLRGTIVKCGCCGFALSYHKRIDPIYRCYHTAANPNAACHKMGIRAELLDNTVLTAIRGKAQAVLGCADLYNLRRKSADQQKIADYEAVIRKNAEERQLLYERFALGEIPRDEYLALKEEANDRSDRLHMKLTAMKAELEADRIKPYSITIANAAVSETANNRELVETLIHSIKVYPDKRIDINWKISEFGISGRLRSEKERT